MKILFVATVQSHIAQFHLGAISLLKEHGYEIHVAARNNLAEKNGLQLKNVDCVFDVPFDRSPFSSKNIGAYRELKKIIDRGNYDIIHCNTPVGGILTRIAAKKTRKEGTKVIYTAHGFHFYKGAPLKNWLVYYPIEKIMAHLTDKLVTINQEDFLLASRKFSCPSYHVHGVGIKTEKYNSVTDEKASEFRQKLNLQNDFVILCIGELNDNKNQSTIIQAMKKVLMDVPNAKLLLAGNGPNELQLKELIKKLNLQEKVIMLGYCSNLEWYVHACNVVVSASIREGLGLNVLEGMYCKKAVVASLNRGHKEIITNNENGFLVEAKKSEAFAEKIIQLAKNSKEYDCFVESSYNRAKAYTDYNVIKELSVIYDLK